MTAPMTAAGFVSELLLGAGVLVAVASSVAALLVRSLYDRLHFLTPVTSLAGPLVGASLAIENGWGTTTGQILFVVLLLAVTGPVLGAATGRLARRGAEPDPGRSR
ncbi:MAG: multicomponent Na+:H+ antiporter subunit [Pseudonocardiales bacterium]|nr:multicomponent Na+:H+ antiporter subunit [Pseudonocardiales bacterium]MDT7694584.1 multicomponent Na+:H+ antiporter subunit [Pseudonocardiales bacterium]